MFKRPAAILFPAVAGSVGWLRVKAQVSACSSGANLHSAHEGKVSSMRVVTYNVRRFKSNDGMSTAPAIGDALASLQPSLVALNEVDTRLRPEGLATVAERLGGFSIAFFGHVRGQYGNALLSKYPIKAIRETHLRGGTEVSFPPGTKKLNGEIAKEGEFHRIARGLLECDIELPATSDAPGRVVTVAVTHLDHISEKQRVTQLTHVLEALGPNVSRAMVVGDLNALHRSDYTEEEWAVLEQRAKTNKWSAPTSGCLDLLRAAGFTDAFATSRGLGPLSARAQASSDPIFSAHVGHPLYRIDYCFVSGSSGLRPRDSRVHTDIELSDHFPVSFDFQVLDIGARL